MQNRWYATVLSLMIAASILAASFRTKQPKGPWTNQVGGCVCVPRSVSKSSFMKRRALTGLYLA